MIANINDCSGAFWMKDISRSLPARIMPHNRSPVGKVVLHSFGFAKTKTEAVPIP